MPDTKQLSRRCAKDNLLRTQTGVVKGVENTPEAVLSASLGEVTKYMNLTNHLEGPSTISMSDEAFRKLA